MDEVVSLREFIDNKDKTSVKVNTFCRLMKHVSDAIEKDDRALIRINLDEIKINVKTGEVVLPDSLFNDNDMNKTIANFNTGVSLVAERKSSLEHKRVSFALMVLGWYANEDHSAVISDLDVLDNFDMYMSKVPSWLQGFFVSVFRKMDYSSSFSDYYDKNFTDKVKSEISDAFREYNLNSEQIKRIQVLVAKTTARMIKEGV